VDIIKVKMRTKKEVKIRKIIDKLLVGIWVQEWV
jgi:hypothetical protein